VPSWPNELVAVIVQDKTFGANGPFSESGVATGGQGLYETLL